MLKKFLIISVCGILFGCSNKPDVTDIKPQLQKGWSCEGLKITNLKKDNGIDRGNSYDMDVSYDVEVTKEFYEEDRFKCDSLIVYQFENQLVFPLKKGHLISVKDTYRMVNSEKGWVSEKCSYCLRGGM